MLFDTSPWLFLKGWFFLQLGSVLVHGLVVFVGCCVCLFFFYLFVSLVGSREVVVLGLFSSFVAFCRPLWLVYVRFFIAGLCFCL